jgi:hypothetical protein
MLEASVYYTAKDSDENKKSHLHDLVSNLATFAKFDQRPRPMQKSTLESKKTNNRQLH